MRTSHRPCVVILLGLWMVEAGTVPATAQSRACGAST